MHPHTKAIFDHLGTQSNPDLVSALLVQHAEFEAQRESDAQQIAHYQRHCADLKDKIHQQSIDEVQLLILERIETKLAELATRADVCTSNEHADAAQALMLLRDHVPAMPPTTEDVIRSLAERISRYTDGDQHDLTPYDTIAILQSVSAMLQLVRRELVAVCGEDNPTQGLLCRVRHAVTRVRNGEQQAETALRELLEVTAQRDAAERTAADLAADQRANPAIEAATLQSVALALLEGGFSIVLCYPQGHPREKQPLANWRPLLDTPLTDEEVRAFYEHETPYAIALICGYRKSASHATVAALDFDSVAQFYSFTSQLSVSLTDKLYIEESPHGVHVLFRWIPPADYTDAGEPSEFRSQNKYIIVAPSNGYSRMRGDLFNLPVLATSEVDYLVAAAQFSEKPAPQGNNDASQIANQQPIAPPAPQPDAPLQFSRPLESNPKKQPVYGFEIGENVIVLKTYKNKNGVISPRGMVLLVVGEGAANMVKCSRMGVKGAHRSIPFGLLRKATREEINGEPAKPKAAPVVEEDHTLKPASPSGLFKLGDLACPIGNLGAGSTRMLTSDVGKVVAVNGPVITVKFKDETYQNHEANWVRRPA